MYEMLFDIWIIGAISISVGMLTMMLVGTYIAFASQGRLNKFDAQMILSLIGISLFSWLWPVALVVGVIWFLGYVVLLALGVIDDR